MRPLTDAAKNGRLTQVQQLLDEGADPNERNEDNNESPLHEAVFYRWTNIVALLLDRGADVNGRLRLGNTVLVQAAGVGNIELTHILINRGAELDRATDWGVTPLITAAYGGHYETVKYLLGLGANVTAQDESGMTALDWAKVRKHRAVATLLRKAESSSA